MKIQYFYQIICRFCCAGWLCRDVFFRGVFCEPSGSRRANLPGLSGIEFVRIIAVAAHAGSDRRNFQKFVWPLILFVALSVDDFGKPRVDAFIFAAGDQGQHAVKRRTDAHNSSAFGRLFRSFLFRAQSSR